jgi:hypothetical protein
LLAQLSGSRENARVSIGKHLPDWDEKAMEINRADVAELVDARDLKCLAPPERSHLLENAISLSASTCRNEARFGKHFGGL